jgi:hypothetical protein
MRAWRKLVVGTVVAALGAVGGTPARSFVGWGVFLGGFWGLTCGVRFGGGGVPVNGSVFWGWGWLGA